MIGIIGGTGFYGPEFLGEHEQIEIETRYGDAVVFMGNVGRKKVVFLARHGSSHNIPPHKVNYKRNISALKISGVEKVISINSVGSLDKSLAPGSIVLPHDFIDFTGERDSTFYDEEVVHVDMTEPYCREIRDVLFDCAGQFYDDVLKEGVYVCTQGPRFETPSEIQMLRMLGGDIVGMVGLPEVVLAREAGLCYASICTVANYGCGISKSPLTIDEVKGVVSENLSFLKKTIKLAIESIPEKRGCMCGQYLSEAGV